MQAIIGNWSTHTFLNSRRPLPSSDVFKDKETVMTRLDRFLESIDPIHTMDQVSARVDEAINSFRINSGVIENWDEFRITLTRFYRHVENITLRIRPDFSADHGIDWGRCCNLLLKEYGHNGEKAAFEMVRAGVEKGLYGVLKTVARRMIAEYSTNEIAARIAAFWGSLSTDEQLGVCKEYLHKYGHLLTTELTEGSAARIRADFLQVLKQHPGIMKRLRNIGRG
jgi:hypothetical protein